MRGPPAILLAGNQGQDARGDRSALCGARLVPAAHFGEQAQDFQVEPDQRDHDAEGAVPLHVLGSADLHAPLDEVEVEHQIEGGDADDEEAETDADEARSR